MWCSSQIRPAHQKLCAQIQCLFSLTEGFYPQAYMSLMSDNLHSLLGIGSNALVPRGPTRKDEDKLGMLADAHKSPTQPAFDKYA